MYVDSHSSPRAWHSCDSTTEMSSLDSTSGSLPEGPAYAGGVKLPPGPLPSPGSAQQPPSFLDGVHVLAVAIGMLTQGVTC